MTLLDVASWGGFALCIVIVAFIGVLVIAKRTKPDGAHHITDEDKSWPPELPDRHPAPPHPDGGVR